MLKEKLANNRYYKVLGVPPAEENNLLCISVSLPIAEPATHEKVPSQSRRMGVVLLAEEL